VTDELLSLFFRKKKRKKEKDSGPYQLKQNPPNFMQGNIPLYKLQDIALKDKKILRSRHKHLQSAPNLTKEQKE
jgi:hypothetical protein